MRLEIQSNGGLQEQMLKRTTSKVGTCLEKRSHGNFQARMQKTLPAVHFSTVQTWGESDM